MYKKTNNYFEQESGRSMVEMLGVLAIIGVLSVGGISGYTIAMNKHKANEILNAAAVRAMAVSSQLQSGTPIGSVSLGEFDNENSVGGATFAAGVTDAGNNRFTIGFANNGKPSDAVIEQMQNIAGTDGIVRDLTGTGITYNNDLTADKIASDFTYDTCPSNFVKCGKTNSCVATAADCQCPTHATDNDTSCTCNAGYTGPKCDICDTANGYESDGEGGCKKNKEGKFHIISGSFDHPTAITKCAEYDSGDGAGKWSLASAGDIGCAYDTSCAETLQNLTYEGTGWSEGTFLWLSNCYDSSKNDKDGGDSCYGDDIYSSFAFYVYNDGTVNSLYDRGNYGRALCVR